jgi:L-threonylcarbamoyladenylate synthase
MPAKDAPVTHSQPRTALRLAPDADGIARAAALLRAGRLVAFPTETVYGLGALATDQDAARAIYAAKGRPSFNPLIAHIAAPADALRWAVIPPLAARLIEAFWPGPLTLVLPLARQIKGDARIAPAVTAGGATIALRCPAHPLARALLAAVGAHPVHRHDGAFDPDRAGAAIDHRVDPRDIIGHRRSGRGRRDPFRPAARP